MRILKRIVTVAAIVAAAGPLRAEDGTRDLPHALRLIEDSAVGLKSLRIGMTVRTSNPLEPKAPPSEVAYDEVWRGENWRLERRVPVSGKMSIERTEAYDGTKHYSLTPATKFGRIAPKRKMPFEGWASLYGSAEGAWGVLSPVRGKLSGGWIETGKKRLLAVRWSDPKDVDQEMHLDPSVDFQPRWWRSVRKPSDKSGKLVTVTKTVTFDDYQASREFWFVSRGTRVVETVLDDGRTLRQELSFVVTRLEPNVTVADADFRIPFPEGVTVFVGDVPQKGARK